MQLSDYLGKDTLMLIPDINPQNPKDGETARG
jgi:hypothetical protein